MERSILLVLVFSAAGSLGAKYVFISERLTWSQARGYCRDNHNDLLPLSNNQEFRSFVRTVGDGQIGWIGLYRDQPSFKWKWSGGVEDDSQEWVSRYLNITENFYSNKQYWYVRDGAKPGSFFCLNLIVVQEQKTWEDALDHCAHTSRNFTSLLSETENLLAKREIQDSAVTERVWIGLRFLGDRWLWVNGDPLQYQAWSPGGDECPAWTRCGALNKQGEWESRDCEEKLDFICA